MKRYQRIFLSIVAFLGLWYGLWKSLLPLDFLGSGLQAKIRLILPALPLYALVTFGAYSLFVIGWRLFTFPECPDAAEELKRQRAQARAELSKHGITFSSKDD